MILTNRSLLIKALFVLKEASDYTFQLDYVSVDDCLPQICQLHRASTLPPGEQTAMVWIVCNKYPKAYLSQLSPIFNSKWKSAEFEVKT